jgi:hypothetical protein
VEQIQAGIEHRDGGIESHVHALDQNIQPISG